MSANIGSNCGALNTRMRARIAAARGGSEPKPIGGDAAELPRHPGATRNPVAPRLS